MVVYAQAMLAPRPGRSPAGSTRGRDATGWRPGHAATAPALSDPPPPRRLRSVPYALIRHQALRDFGTYARPAGRQQQVEPGYGAAPSIRAFALRVFHYEASAVE